MTTVSVPHNLVEEAWEKWLELHYGLDCEETEERFCKFVDRGDQNQIPVNPWSDEDVDEDGNIPVNPDIADRLRQITGPHRNTILQAWYANHPWKT